MDQRGRGEKEESVERKEKLQKIRTRSSLGEELEQKGRGRGHEDRHGDKRGGEQMGGGNKGKEGWHRRGEEMAALQRSSRFKSGPPFHGDRPMREGLGETVSEN